MTSTLPDLPPEGSTGWYNHYAGLDARLRGGWRVLADSTTSGASLNVPLSTPCRDLRVSLQLRHTANTSVFPVLTFNGDTGANYVRQMNRFGATNVQAVLQTAQTGHGLAYSSELGPFDLLCQIDISRLTEDAFAVINSRSTTATSASAPMNTTGGRWNGASGPLTSLGFSFGVTVSTVRILVEGRP